MPATKQHQSSDPDDIWTQCKGKIRRLYQDENRSIDYVKNEMEAIPGFPIVARSTFIEKLGQLGIRKNASMEEWCIIYHHILPRLKDSTRPERDKKAKRTVWDIEVIVRGKSYNWDKAWRSMRRARDRAKKRNLRLGGYARPLPDGIVIKIRPRTSNKYTQRDSSGDLVTTLVPKNHFGPDSVALLANSADECWRFFFVGLPIEVDIQHVVKLACHPSLVGTFNQNARQEPNRAYSSIALPFGRYSDAFGVSNGFQSILAHGMLSAVLGNPLTDLAAFTIHNKAYISLFQIIYLLSNGLTEDDDDHIFRSHKHRHGSGYHELFCSLDSIFASLPSKYLEDLLRSRLSKYWYESTFPPFVLLSGIYKQPKTFEFLVKFGAAWGGHWLAVKGKEQDLLVFAVSMNLPGALRTLLKNRCRPDSFTDKCQSGWTRTAIVEAFERGNTECVQLLLSYCDVNKPIGYYHAMKRTNFDCFLLSVHENGELLESGLKSFLEAGANLDVCAPQSRPYPDLQSSELYQQNFMNRKYDIELRFSVLDYLFYFHPPLFDKFSHRSARVHHGSLSRTGVLLALNGGAPNLKEYLDRLGREFHQERQHRLFQQLIAEQFLIHDFRSQKKATDLDTVRVLLSSSFGTSFKEVLHLFPHILQDFTALVGVDCLENEIEAARYLIKNGATINFETISWFARLPVPQQFDFAQHSVENRKAFELALVDAAARNNLEAVERLIRTGVDLCNDILLYMGLGGSGFRVSLIANVIYSWTPKSNGLSEMLDFLVKKGAPLRLSASKPHWYQLLHFTMNELLPWGGQALLETVQYIIDAAYNPHLQDQGSLSASLLESCCDMDVGIEIFQYLFRKGAPMRPGSPMATWIGLGGGIDLVREMLQAGADLNAYARRSGRDIGTGRYTALQVAALKWRTDIVELLLGEGADVNAPARGSRGLTALEASCLTRAASSIQQERKLKTVRLLLDHHADVNAAPARYRGLTALQATAACGDLAVANLLLPGADVNAPPCKEMGFGNALDLAARNGRIDMVKFLLNWNTVSHDWGLARTPSQYRGATREASYAGHMEVTELIEKHMKDAEKSGFINPCMSQPRRCSSEHRYDSVLEGESEYQSDEVYSSDYSTSDEEEYEGTPSATSQQDPSEASSSVALGNSTDLPAQDELPMPAADENIAVDMESPHQLPEGAPTEFSYPSFLQSWPDFGSEDCMDYAMTLNGDTTVLQHAASRNPGFDGLCDACDGDRMIEEVDEDCD